MADPAQTGFDDPELTQTDGVSAEDQEEILKEIEKVASDHRISVSAESLAFTARRNGAVFPILVNVVGLAILAGGVFGLAYLFQTGEQQLRESAQVVVTAESRLIEEIRRETEQQIAEREAEIASIQDQLDSISSERAQIAADIDQQLAAREAELRSEFDAALAAERQRLLGLNLSEAEIEQRLAEFQAERQREFDAQLAAARDRSLQEQAALEAELNQLEQQFSASLSAANTARQELLAESEQRLSDLQQEFEANLAASEAQLGQAEAQLAELARQREREELVRAQIRGLYETTADAIESSDFDAARGRLRDLRTLLNEENTLRLEALREQRPVELFLIGSLESLVGYEERFGNPETIGRLSDAGLVQQVTELAERAARAAAGGNTTEAARLYREALTVIPAVEESSAFLGQQVGVADAREQEAINAAAEQIVIQGRNALQAETYPEAVQLFSRAVRNYPTSRFRVEALGGITTAVDAIVSGAAQAQDELSSELAALETEIATLTEDTAEQNAALEALQLELEQSLDEGDQLRADGATTQSEVERLQTEIETATAAIATLERDLGAAESELLATLDDLTAAEAQTAELQAALTRNEAELSQTRTEPEQVPQTEQEPQTVTLDPQTAAELDQLRELSARLAVAQDNYAEYRRQAAANLESASELEVINARVALGAFLNQNAMREFFPGLSDEFARYEQAYVESGRQNALLDAADLLIELSEVLQPIERVEIVEDALIAAEDPAYQEFLAELLFLLELEL